MTEFNQLPGELNIKVVDGNDLSFKTDWATDTSLYTFSAWIQPIGTVSTIIPFTISVIDAFLGTYTISVSKTALAALPLNREHRWRMDRLTTSSAIVRTVLAGTFTVEDK